MSSESQGENPAFLQMNQGGDNDNDGHDQEKDKIETGNRGKDAGHHLRID